MRIKSIFRFFLVLSMGFSLIVTSCNTAKKVPYFDNISDSLNVASKVPHGVYEEHKIAPNDILQVNIQTIDLNTHRMFSQESTTETVGTQHITGYLVDKDGYIELPLVGRVKVEGLTTTQAKDLIRKKASISYKEPVVNVRFANFYVTILGEVANPGRYIVTNEKVSVIDAIGMAGDLTIYGRRENVMLIREENGQKVFVRYNMNNTESLNTPYFYLKSGDVIYVEPNKAKARTATTDASRDRYFTILASALSLAVSIILITR